jgi:hypothetical protein
MLLPAMSHTSHNSQSQQNSTATGSALANVTTAPSPALTEMVDSVKINGKTYYSAPPAPATSTAQTDFVRTVMTSGTLTPFSHHSYEAFTIVNSSFHVSINWASHTWPLDGVDTTPKLVAYSAACAPINDLSESPFILDSGAICHISPIKLDFKSLHPIAPYPITGIGGSCVHATGVGSIKLCIASNHKVVLEDMLYMPALTICLVSVLCLNCSEHYTTSFDSDSY